MERSLQEREMEWAPVTFDHVRNRNEKSVFVCLLLLLNLERIKSRYIDTKQLKKSNY